VPDPPTVLLVDDDLDSRMIYGRVLSHVGYRVIEAVGGQQAVNVARTSKPDAIVVDLGLPDMDGLAVIRALRADPTTREAAIVVLTAYASRSDESYAAEAGCDVFLAKPTLPRDLAAAIDELIASRRPSEPVEPPEPQAPALRRPPAVHREATSPPMQSRSPSPDLADWRQ